MKGHLRGVGIALLSVLSLPTWAQTPQTWPERAVRVIVPVPAGGSPDIVARLLGEKLAPRWSTKVVVENRPGADGIIGIRAVLEAGDNHTLLIAPSGMLTATPAMKEVPYDLSDLVPLSTVAVDFLVVAVPATSPAKSLSDLVASARERPDRLNWFAVAGAPALAFGDFLRRARLDMVHVPYKGGPEALRDLAEDRIQVAVVPLAPALGAAQAGRLRILAVTNPERAPKLPEVPTAAEAGYPELTIEGVLGAFAPRSLPAEVRERAAADIRAAVDDPDIGNRLAKGGQVARRSTPADYAAFLEAERRRWREVIRSASDRPSRSPEPAE